MRKRLPTSFPMFCTKCHRTTWYVRFDDNDGVPIYYFCASVRRPNGKFIEGCHAKLDIKELLK